ncbi:MAG: 4Fe-4S binding protein [Deltaproteobacteria bacterium]|nr:4Fe-4S binding protein [Deltaproteobacteria bacterium]
MKRKTVSLNKLIRLVFCVAVLLLFITDSVWASGGGGRRSMGFFDVLLLPRVWIAAIFCTVGLGLLIKSWVNRKVRLLFLAAIFFFFGILPALPLGKFAWGMGLHPSPVCSITKPFLFLIAGRQVPTTFITILIFISVMSVIGNKLFCGWACPIGAIQEIFHKIPLRKKFKRILPFGATNLFRTAFFIAFMVMILTAGVSIYDYFNPFHFLHWRFEFTVIIVLLVTLTASTFFFRPFCYMICPIGLYTWVLEHFSLLKVRVDKGNCKDCNLCIKKSSCPAVQSILDEKKSRPDCFACGRCMEACPEKVLRFA